MPLNNPHQSTAVQIPEYSTDFFAEMSKPITKEEAMRRATHRHYKGGLYRVVAEATHTETGEALVIREHVWPHASSIKARPAALFNGKLEDGTPRYRKLTKIIIKPYVPMIVDQGVGALRHRMAVVETLDDVEKIDFIKSWLDNPDVKGLRVQNDESTISIYAHMPNSKNKNMLIAYVDYVDPSLDPMGKWPAVSFE
jgi:hypothetical protein